MGRPQNKKISMQSIADAVGVARSTVSFVLNGKEKEGHINEEMAAKVREMAEEMNYDINSIARSLRTWRSYFYLFFITLYENRFLTKYCCIKNSYCYYFLCSNDKLQKDTDLLNLYITL